MRITIVIGPYFPIPPIWGGAVERIQFALAEEYAAHGHDVTMISRSYGDLPQEGVRAGVRHLRVKSWDVPQSRIRFRLYDLLYARRVAKILPKSDVTVTNSLFLPMVLPKSRAGRIYVHAARYPKGQMWLYGRVDRIQTVSEAVARAIRWQTPFVARRVIVIPNPLVGPLAIPMQSPELSARSRTVLYVGRIAREKGIHLLVEAFAREAAGALAGYNLEIIGSHEIRHGGDGAEYLRRLHNLAAPARNAVSFGGFISDMNELRRAYEAADIFVYPSIAERGESFGSAPLEAMAAGCRVLVSDLGCFREYLEPGRNGRVFDHRHDPVAALAAALCAMAHEANPDAMREAAVATATHFQLGPIATRLLDDFARVIVEPRSRPTTAAVPAVAPPQSGDMLPAPHIVPKQRLRITFALGPYFPVPPVLGGGVERIQVALAEEYARRGHEVTVISRCYADFPREEIVAGVHHLRVVSRDAPSSKGLFRLYDFVYGRHVAAVLPKSDITVTNSLFLPLVLPRRLAGHLYVRAGRYPKGQMWLYPHVDRVHTPSVFVADAIRRQTPILAGRIIAIPNPLVGPLAVPMRQPGLSPRTRTILYVGRVAREKGIHHLIQAFAKESTGALAGYRLRIVGSHEIRHGGDGPEYLRQLQELGASAKDSILFDGLVADIRVLRKIYEDSDIFVFPSQAERGESFGSAPLEAMAAGCRVLVSDLACFREYLDPDRNGRVYDYRRDPVTALEAALTAMVCDPDPNPMREAAVATAARFQIGPIADRFLEDFARVIDGIPLPRY